jgi:2-phospho-L-lactate guanylyltransferase
VERWAVVVPVKELRVAKTRLDLPPERRAALALAMALDVVAACLDCPAVGLVVVVTNDERAAAAVRRLGAVVVPDTPEAGIDAALGAGARAARGLLPGAGVAALSSDLPAATPRALGEALAAAAAHDRALVSDAAGTGTTLLTARPGADLAPAYGPASRDAHAAAGAVELDATAWPGLRRDVDTLADLAEALRIGAGRHTARLG